jgi:hypothetical protein
MNTVIKAGAIGALALAGAAAHASIALPSTNNSDAILFAEVVNAAGTAAVASYAGDTGVSINSLLTGVSGSKTYLGGDANLAKLFAADASGDTIQFAVLGGQWSGAVSAGNFKTPGVAQFLTTVSGNSTASLNNDVTGSLTKFAGIATDISNINTNSGGANTIEGGSPAGAGIWDVTNLSGLAFWDGGSTSNSDALGTTLNLYSVTAGVGGLSSTKVGYTLQGTASLSASGLTLAAISGTPPPPPVPLPAAVWLLGSGLLGLTGVARRKLKV